MLYGCLRKKREVKTGKKDILKLDLYGCPDEVEVTLAEEKEEKAEEEEKEEEKEKEKEEEKEEKKEKEKEEGKEEEKEEEKEEADSSKAKKEKKKCSKTEDCADHKNLKSGLYCGYIAGQTRS